MSGLWWYWKPHANAVVSRVLRVGPIGAEQKSDDYVPAVPGQGTRNDHRTMFRVPGNRPPVVIRVARHVS